MPGIGGRTHVPDDQSVSDLAAYLEGAIRHGGNVDRDLLTPQLEPEMNLIRCKHSAPVRDCLSREQFTADDHCIAQRR